MSRHVVGAPPNPFAAVTSVSFFFAEPTLQRLVEVVCSGCGKTERVFGKRDPEGWQTRFGGMRGMLDFCSPECWEPWDEKHRGSIWA